MNFQALALKQCKKSLVEVLYKIYITCSGWKNYGKGQGDISTDQCPPNFYETMICNIIKNLCLHKKIKIIKLMMLQVKREI